MPSLGRLLDRPLILSLLLVGVLVWSAPTAYRGFKSVANDVVEWMPEGFQATQDLKQFVELFATDELMMICWDGQTAEDPRADRLAKDLMEPPAEGQESLFRQTLSSGELLRAFQEPPLEWERDRALRSTAGWLTDRSGENAGVLAVVSAAGAVNRGATLEWLRTVAHATPGLEKMTLRIAGSSVESVAIDRASQDGLLQLNLISFAVCTLMLAVFLRSVRAAILIFLLALFNEQLCLAIAWQAVGKMDSIMMLAANMTFVLSISIGVHLFNYYRDALAAGDQRGAPARAIAAGWQPTFFSVLTTAIGLSALAISQMKPIARFGEFASIGLIAAMFVVVIYLPLHFLLWPLNKTDEIAPKQRSAIYDRLAARLASHATTVSVLAVVLLLGVGMGAARLRTSVGLSDMLRPSNPLIENYRWIEDHVGQLIPVEVVINTPASDPKELVRQFRAIEAVHKKLSNELGDTTVISAVNFAGEPPSDTGGFRGAVLAAAFRRGLVSSLDELGNFGMLKEGDDGNHWRLTVRTSLFRADTYGDLVRSTHDLVTAELANWSLGGGDAVLVTGGVPLVYRAQQQMLNDLLTSFALTFVLVLLSMAFVVGGLLKATLCMVPNLLPIGLLFGAMGWTGSPADIGAVMTATAALGVAVDDTLHFLKWFRLATEGGADRTTAVAAAWRTCGGAMVQSTAVCVLGLAVFTASDFLPINRFGVCMATLLTLALLADLVVLPAILLSPAGQLFTGNPEVNHAD